MVIFMMKKNFKICFEFALFLLLNFFIIDSCSAAITYYRIGSTDSADTQYSTDPSNSVYLDWYNAYRFTFVDKSGEKISGTNSVDIKFRGYNPWDFGGEYYTGFKFGTSSIKKDSFSGYSSTDDEYYMNKIITSISNNGDIIEKIKSRTNNNKLDKGEFLVVEKLYTIDIITSEAGPNISKLDLCTQSQYKDLLAKVEENDEFFSCYNISYDPNSNQIAVVLEEQYHNYFTGTGLQILNLLKDTSVGNSINGKTVTKGLKYIKNNISIPLFAGELVVDSSELKDLKNLEFKKLTSSGSGCDDMNFDCALEVNRGYGLNVFTLNSDDIDECNISNYSTYDGGRAWNSAEKKCCAKGEIYDSYTKKCTSSKWSESKTFTPTGTTTTYTYTASPSVNICKDSTVNSTIKNLSSCSYKKNNGSETKLTGSSLADCVLYNPKYSVGNGVYCMETLNTDFSSFKSNFNSKYSNGKFIPISNYPSLTKKIVCYAKQSSTSGTSLSNYVNSLPDTSPSTSSMLINVDFLNGQSTYKFNSSKSIISNKSNSPTYSSGTTNYGVDYTSLSFDLIYNYSYVNDSLNKYIKIQNAQGSIDKINSRYKTMTQNINFNIPTDTEPGTYSTSISLSGLDSNVSNITNGTDYQKQLTTTGGTSYCKISYESNIDIGYCKSNFNTWKGNGTVVGYDASWDNGLCKIEITYSGFTKFACDGISTGNSTIKTNYFTSGNTTKLKFNNDSISSSNISCSFNIEVGKKIEDILIYRPIDLSNPFPGKNGKGRTAGSNWSESDITNYIKSRQEAYTKKPMYSFTLTPSNIKKIREYNKTHTYDDFNLNCRDEGSACFSEFIATYKGMMNKDKSSCYFATNEERTVASFNSCADYTKR